jgi:hypothetical protein
MPAKSFDSYLDDHTVCDKTLFVDYKTSEMKEKEHKDDE